MPTARLTPQIRDGIDLQATGAEFSLPQVIETVWDTLTDTEKRMLGKQFRAAVGIPPFVDVQFIADSESPAMYRRI